MIGHPYRRLATVLATAVGVGVGVGAIAVPAAVGLSNNPTFSQHLPVPVPSIAHRVGFDDHGTLREAHARHARQVEPRDNHGRHLELGDDHRTRRRP
ncbi:MAG TPA: hypothetical protein VIG48_00110 [Jatrophihabitans sp.]